MINKKKERYAKNNAISKITQQKRLQKIYEYLQNKSCFKCNLTNPYFLRLCEILHNPKNPALIAYTPNELKRKRKELMEYVLDDGIVLCNICAKKVSAHEVWQEYLKKFR